MTELATITPPTRLSLVQRIAQRFDVDADKLLTTMKATCFRSDKPITNEQMMSLLIVAEQYHLNPFTKELFAFDDKRGGIIPYVSVDGWSRIINEQPQFDGMEFLWDREQESMTCVMYRKDRSHPTTVTEYLAECRRNTQPWTTAPRRMLRHKAMMQCGRLAFGFTGISDQDEAERIRDGGMVERVDAPSTQRTNLKRVLHGPATVADTHVPSEEEQQEIVEEAMHSTLADLTAEMLGSTSLDDATEILDRGRSILDEADFAQLDRTFEDLFNGR